MNAFLAAPTVLITRAITSTVLKYAQYFPAIGITGPRQSGKSTLARQCFPHLPYISFENPQVCINTRADFAGFLKKYKEGAIFDEIQHIPELLSYLQTVIDEDRSMMGRFIITGSQNFALVESITQSLAGRIGMLTLLPLSLAELQPEASYDHSIIHGGYPGMHQLGMTAQLFFTSYIMTYLERDVRQLKNIGNLSAFQAFIRLCAARIGWPLNLSDLSRDAGVSVPTVREWLNVLEASYIAYTVAPYYKNYGKRLIKAPKLYFYDTGLAAYLLNIMTAEQLETHYLRGNLFENAAINEIMKCRLNAGHSSLLYFLRDSHNKEIDVIGEWDGVLHAIEIKYNATVSLDHLRNIMAFQELSKAPCQAAVIYAGDTIEELLQARFIPLHLVAQIFTS